MSRLGDASTARCLAGSSPGSVEFQCAVTVTGNETDLYLDAFRSRGQLSVGHLLNGLPHRHAVGNTLTLVNKRLGRVPPRHDHARLPKVPTRNQEFWDVAFTLDGCSTLQNPFDGILY